MKATYKELLQEYMGALRAFLSDQDELALHEAYELGRRSIARGMGIVDMVKIHDAVMVELFSKSPEADLIGKGVGAFLAECLSPFEIIHRGFSDSNLSLRKANESLEERNHQFASANEKLRNEIIERKRVERELRESEKHYRVLFNQARMMQENLRYLSAQILHVQEEERKRISRELHDEFGQALTAVNVSLAFLKNAVNGGAPDVQKKITDTQKLLEQTMEAVHSFSRELRPAMLDDLGIIPALRSFVKSFADRTKVVVSFRATEEVERLESEQKTVLYRVAQESLTNIAKHAQASHGSITLRKAGNGVAMEIKDNGKSFRVNEKMSPRNRNRLGLLGIQERIRLANGKLHVESTPGKGTKLLVWLPHNK